MVFGRGHERCRFGELIVAYMSTQPEQDANELPKAQVIQVDGYGIKARVDLQPTDIQEIATWRDVSEKIHLSLKRIVAGTFGLAEEVVDTARVLIRGIAARKAVARTIEQAQKKAKALEGQAQHKLLANPPLSAEQALQQVRAMQDLLRAKGIDLQVQVIEGRIVFTALKVEDAQLAFQIVKELFPEKSLSGEGFSVITTKIKLSNEMMGRSRKSRRDRR